MSFDRLPAFLEGLSERNGQSARALEFAILTAARTNEVVGARWSELDLEEAIWTVPAERMKAGREHRVPLSLQAVAIVRSLDCFGDGTFVFGTSKGAKPLSIMGMAMMLRRMDIAATVHGFRSTFRDWAAETTNFTNEVCEMALAHAIQGKAEAAYRRGDLFLKRRRLMEQWGRFCAGAKEETQTEDAGQVPEAARLRSDERDALFALLSAARCPLCGSGWGDPCRSANDTALLWSQSHDRRFMRLVEDWALAADGDLSKALLSAQAEGNIPKSGVIKLELARRALTPSAWATYLSEAS